MRGLHATDLVSVWDRGLGRGPTDRALLALGAAFPERPRADLAALPIGRRDALICALRQLTLGSRIDARVVCPSCHDQLEFDVDTAALGLPSVAEALDGDSSPPAQTLHVDDYEIVVRAPTSEDLLAAAAVGGIDEAAALIADRCVVSARRDGRDVTASTLTPHLRAAIAISVAEADPFADLGVAMTCSTCGHHWTVELDIASVFWTEIGAAADRLLREVDVLARTYAWHESDILAMSAARRQRYVELAAS